jgi:hypothetical protein
MTECPPQFRHRLERQQKPPDVRKATKEQMLEAYRLQAETEAISYDLYRRLVATLTGQGFPEEAA